LSYDKTPIGVDNVDKANAKMVFKDHDIKKLANVTMSIPESGLANKELIYKCR
jgi:hypothetical protein